MNGNTIEYLFDVMVDILAGELTFVICEFLGQQSKKSRKLEFVECKDLIEMLVRDESEEGLSVALDERFLPQMIALAVILSGEPFEVLGAEVAMVAVLVVALEVDAHADRITVHVAHRMAIFVVGAYFVVRSASVVVHQDGVCHAVYGDLFRRLDKVERYE